MENDTKQDLHENHPSDNSPTVSEQSIESTKPYQDRDIVWPLFLIFLGVMFLLNTTGVVSWNVWGVMWRFWPVFIIFSGLQLMFGKGKIGSWIVGLLALILFSFIGITALSIIESPILERFNITVPQQWENIIDSKGEQKTTQSTIALKDYEDVDELNLILELGIGKLTVVDDDSDNILSLDASYFEHWGEPTLEQNQKDKTLTVTFSQDQNDGFLGFNKTNPEYDLTLGQDELPTSVTIGLGAGEVILDIDAVLLDGLNGDVGAGKLVVSLSEESIPESMKLNVGAGAVEINLPENIGYSIDYSVGVGEISSRGQEIGGLGSDGEKWESENFDEADKTISIEANVGAGKITIN